MKGIKAEHLQKQSLLLTFESEMFTFVEHPEVPSGNNKAEGCVHPRIVVRNRSAGSRSPKGSKMMDVTSSLLAFGKLLVRSAQHK